MKPPPDRPEVVPPNGVPGMVGPNAVTQLRGVLIDAVGEQGARALFETAGMAPYYDNPPRDMIDERVPALLFKTLFATFETDKAHGIAFQAGQRTANYVMARRIPDPAKRILKVLPPVLAGPMLLKAIAKNAWTFAGSGDFRSGTKPQIFADLVHNPLNMPGAAWHVGVFTRLFQALVCADAQVRHRRRETPAGKTDRFLICYGQPQLGKDCAGASRNGPRRLCLGCVAR